MPARTLISRPLISVEEYLRTSYRPGCDYVDGEVVERNVGRRDHGWLQTAVAAYFFLRRRQWNITVITERRIQVNAARFRIPDVCVILGDTGEQSSDGLREIKSGGLATGNPRLEVPLREIFA